MTIRELVNACNSHPEIWVDIWTYPHHDLAYSGHYDRLTERMLNWEVDTFDVKELTTMDGGRKCVTRMRIVLDCDAHLQ